MTTSESRQRPEPVGDEAQRLQCPPQIPSLLMVGGPLVAAAAVVGVVVPAALTSWWVLFALFALPPLLMTVCGSVMMTAMRRPMGSGFGTAGSCPPWRRSDVDRATWAS